METVLRSLVLIFGINLSLRHHYLRIKVKNKSFKPEKISAFIHAHRPRADGERRNFWLSKEMCCVWNFVLLMTFQMRSVKWFQWKETRMAKSYQHGGFEVPVCLKFIIPRKTIQLCKYSALRTCGQGTKSFGRVYFPMLVSKLDYLRSPQ